MPNTLAEFLIDEMKRRGMSQRDYARLVGCAASTIGIYAHGTTEPTIDFLRKLSRATGVHLRTLVHLSFPEITTPEDFPADLVLFAREFKELPEGVQDFILTAMRGMKGGSSTNQSPE